MGDAIQQKEMLQIFVRTAPVAIAMFDRRMRYLACSNRWISDYNLGTVDLVGRSHYEIFPEIPDRWKAFHQNGMAGCVERCDEDCFTRKDGTLCWLRWELQPWRAQDGSIGGIVLFSEDITDIKRAETDRDLVTRQRQLALDAARMGWWRYDPVTRLASWDDRYREIFGVTGYSRPNEEILARLHPEDLPRVWARVEAALDPVDPQPYETEFRINLPDGTMKWVEAHGIAEFEGEGDSRRAVNFVGTITDITERRRAAELVAASERRYRDLLETANSIVIRWDRYGIIRYINGYGLRFFGYARAELLGREVMTIVPRIESETGRDLDVLVRDIVVHPERYASVPSENVRKDGEAVWVAWTNKALLDESGEVREILAIGNDITALKKSERALHHLSQFPEQNPNPVLRVGAGGRMHYANTAAEDWLASLAWEPDAPLPVAVTAAVGDACEQRRPIEVEISAPDGRIFGFTAVQPKGESYVNLYGREITERKQAEQALHLREKELEASLEEKDVLLKEVHHRVKNNLQVIASLVDLQLDDIEDAAMQNLLREAGHRVRSMAMVHEKLYQAADLARVEFAEYVESLLGYLQRSFGSTAEGVRLELELEPVSLPVNTAVPCGLVLNELFSNAVKHAFKGRRDGEISVTLKKDEQGAVQLGVRDDGIGLPPDFDVTHARSLGLRLVRMLVRQLHAHLEITGGRGTAFTITFEVPKT